MEKTIPPEKVDTNPKEKMKQMRLPFAPIQKENAITKQKEEQEKERQRIAIEKRLKLEAEKAAQEELDASNQRKENLTPSKEYDEIHSNLKNDAQNEKKRKLSESAEKLATPMKKAYTGIQPNIISVDNLNEKTILDLSDQCTSAKKCTTSTEKLKEKAERDRIKEECRRAKEQQKERERIEKLEEKQKERLEKEEKRKEREAEKIKKDQERESEKLKKEQEREKTKVEKEQKQKEKMEKEEARKEKEVERLKKEEVRKEKEVERLKKEEEREKYRKLKEEEKERLEKLEKEKQHKLVKSFEKFFIKKSPEREKSDDPTSDTNKGGSPESISSGQSPNSSIQSKNNHLSQFHIKKNMRLAPISRVFLNHDAKQSLDFILALSQWENISKLYLNSLKSPIYVASKATRTWPNLDLKNQEKDECLDDYDTPMTEDEEEEKNVASFLQFDENSIVDIDFPNPDCNKKNLMTKSSTSCTEKKNNVFCKTRAKFLQFHENERPPYWGTWSKKSDNIGPRRPFAKDSHYLDYDYDSDDDWEEEEKGESLSDVEKDMEDDEIEDEDDNDGFFVGHGVLDKEEAHLLDSDEEDLKFKKAASNKLHFDKSNLDEDLEIKKMKMKADKFEEEYKRKKGMPSKLKSRVFGCFWKNVFSNEPTLEDRNKGRIIHDQLIRVLQPYSYVVLGCNNDTELFDESGNIETSHSINSRVKQSPSSTTSNISATPKVGDNSDTPNSQGTKKTPGRQKAKFFPEESIPDLIRLVHGNSYNKMFLTREFSAFLQKSTKSESKDGDKEEPNPSHDDFHEDDSKEVEVPKTKIISKIQEIAEYKRWTDSGRMANRMCWIVKPEVLADPKWQQFDFKISEDGPNTWKYILEQPKCTGPGKTPSTNDVGGRDSGDKSNSASPSNTPKRKTVDSSTERDRNLEKFGKSPAPHSLITKFAKILTPEERMQQMTKLREKAEAEREAANSKVQEKIAAVTKELVDSNSTFTIGDLVWGTIKGFPAWPGKIVLPPDDLKRPGIKKLLHCVKFFGTYDFGWLGEQDVKPYHIFRDTLVGGSKTHGFLKAVKEIEEFSLGKNMINAITEPVSIRPESAAPVQEEMVSPMITNDS